MDGVVVFASSGAAALVAHLRDELARTTGDLAVACEVARERGEAIESVDEDLRAAVAVVEAARDYATAESIVAMESTYQSMAEAIDTYDAATGRVDSPASNDGPVSATNPDAYVTAQVSAMTATLRQLWQLHTIAETRAGSPPIDANPSFDSWLRAISGGGR